MRLFVEVCSECQTDFDQSISIPYDSRSTGLERPSKRTQVRYGSRKTRQQSGVLGQVTFIFVRYRVGVTLDEGGDLVRERLDNVRTFRGSLMHRTRQKPRTDGCYPNVELNTSAKFRQLNFLEAFISIDSPSRLRRQSRAVRGNSAREWP